MNLSIRIIYLICITSNGLAKVPPSNGSVNRQLPLVIPQLPIYSHDAIANNIQEAQHQEHRHGISVHSDPWKSQKSFVNVDRSYYKRATHEEHFTDKYKSDNDESDPLKPGMRVFRTYGRGKAQVTRQGQAVNVPNESGRNATNKNENEMKVVKHRVGCRECPPDQTVIATKGNTFAILPEPCVLNSRMWNHIDGPKPGSKIQEGLHWIRGYMGPKKKFCQYHYRVLVHRCESLSAKENMTIKCSADNTWGSICNVSCVEGKEPLGPTILECGEDLSWSNPVPTCKSKLDCTIPKVKTTSKISCQTADMIQFKGDFMPNGSTCKFMQNEKKVSINCKDGRWRIIRKSKTILPKKNKLKSKIKSEKSDPCDPNPCQNGGTCLRPETSMRDPICKCRPQTQGIYCEMRECYYNICENGGFCFLEKEQSICYCASKYNGEVCQYYNPK